MPSTKRQTGVDRRWWGTMSAAGGPLATVGLSSFWLCQIPCTIAEGGLSIIPNVLPEPVPLFFGSLQGLLRFIAASA